MNITYPYCSIDSADSNTDTVIYERVDLRNPFKSFWMGGYECADQINAFGNRVDLLSSTGHLQLIDKDYKSLEPFEIKTVREGIRWSQVEKKPYQYDWSSVKMMLASAKQNDIQQVWDLCHFGFPDDLTPLHPMFARRFAALCKAFAQFYKSQNHQEVLIVTPINEVSFLSWLGGEVKGTSPFCIGQGWEVKYGLMKAYIEGIEALKEVDPGIRILTTEPLVNIIPPENATDAQIAKAAKYHQEQFQVIDMLCGRICPELRGKNEYLDILGFNYYHNNQLIKEEERFLCWKLNMCDSRWVPLHQLLINAYEKYMRPIVLTETSHPREDRALWIKHIADECVKVLEAGMPLWGICWYPIIDRPDWDHLHEWHQSGLWDGAYQNNQFYNRVLHSPLAEALIESQNLLKDYVKA